MARELCLGVLKQVVTDKRLLKSLAGLTIFVVDEAEEWESFDEFEKVLLSIRQKGKTNEVVIVMNPNNKNHWVYTKFLKDTHKLVEVDGALIEVSTKDNVLHIHSSYLDNEDNLSEQYLENLLDIKKTDINRYNHIVMGSWDFSTDGLIFVNNIDYEVKRIDYSDCKLIGGGVDYGYTNDPTTITLKYIQDNTPIYKTIYYKEGEISLNELSKIIKEHRCYFVLDRSDKTMYSELQKRGCSVMKSKGARVLEGIEIMKQQKFIIDRDSKQIQDELHSYIWVKKGDNYINKPIDKFNHCIDTIRYVNELTQEKKKGKVATNSY